MKTFLLAAVLFAGLTLAACGGSGGVNVAPQAVPTLGAPAALAPIRNAGSTSTATGATATFDTSLLPLSQVTLAHDPNALATPAAPLWGVASGVLSVSFMQPFTAKVTSAADAATTAIKLTMPFAASQSGAISSANAPTVAIAHTDGTVVSLVLPGTIDTNANVVTVNVPKALLANATGVKLYLSVDGAVASPIATGPRYWNGSSWSTSGTIKAGVKTLVLIHGIFSSVETAFPCAGAIGAAGKYAQILGFDYNWTQPPTIEGPLFGSFLNSLTLAGVTSFDVEAHSYGTLQTLAAVPSVAKSVKNVILLEGPLPFRGTPLASSYLMRTILGIVAKYWVASPSQIDAAFKSGMVNSLGTNSPEMISLQSAISSIPYPKPNFYSTGGTVEYPEEAYLYPILYWYIDYPWDGVVETKATLSTDIPANIGQTFPLDHTQVPCDPGVISWVGRFTGP